MPAPIASPTRESHDAFDSRPSRHSRAVPDFPAAADLLAGQHELQDQWRDRLDHDAMAASADHRQLHAYLHRCELVFRLHQFAEICGYQYDHLDFRGVAGGLRVFAVALAHCIFNVPLAVWILEGFVSGVPREIDETAFLDGYSFPRFFIKILVPLIASGIGVAAFFCFMFSWVELLLARTLTSVNAKPISAVMTRTVSAAGMDWGLLAAAGVLTIIPGALVIWFVRNYIARGFALGRV